VEKSKECQYGWKVHGKVGGAASCKLQVFIHVMSSKRMFEDADLVVVVVCWEM
jgi:hypothetical protein